MTDLLEGVRTHYGDAGLTARLQAALAAFGPEDQRLTPQQLEGLDQFHVRGAAATADLAALAGITAGMAVLDVGSGVGGPARLLAEACGCRVTGVDLSPAFVEAAGYLTTRTGQADRVGFQVANATALPFPDGAFDAVLLQHVAMNIADRAGLYAEIARVLRPGGRFATYDIVLAAGEPLYPAPWASGPQTSFLLSAEATRAAIEAAGFRAGVWRDDTAAALSWFAQRRAAGPPPGPNLGLVMGPGFAEATANLARSLGEGRLGVLTAVFEAPSAG